MKTHPKNIAIFASGSGSNFENIVQATKNGTLNAHVPILVCDNPQALAIQRAKNHNIPTFVCSPKDYPNKDAYEQAILDKLAQYDLELIALAGYMRLISPTFLDKFPKPIINIHPSYLPAFVGKDAIQQALDSGVATTGVSVHYVDAGMDTGPIIAQQKVDIDPTDTLQTLSQKIHSVEHVLYIDVLRTLLTEENI